MKAIGIGVLVISVVIMSPHSPAQTAEITANYSLIVYNPAKSLAGSRYLNGGGASFGYGLSRHFGLKAEIQGYATTTLSYHLSAIPGIVPVSGTFDTQANMFTYLFGPQLNTFVKKSRIFGDALFGGAYTNGYANLFKAAHVTSLAVSNNGFAMAFGGGIDVPVGENIALRVAQFDYLMTRYEWRQLGINNQSNFRYQAGLAFVMGGH